MIFSPINLEDLMFVDHNEFPLSYCTYENRSTWEIEKHWHFDCPMS